MEDQNRPGGGFKGLWLLPILVAGLWVLIGSWKKMPAQPPSPALTQEQMKREIHQHAKDILFSRIMQEQPKGFTLISFAPYSDGAVAQIGPARFSCSSSLTVRSPSGAAEKEGWQCILMESQNQWTYRNFQHTPPERIPPSKAKSSTIVTGKE